MSKLAPKAHKNVLVSDYQNLQAVFVLICGKPCKIKEVWYSVQHPDGPPLVVVRMLTQEGQK